MTDPYGYQAGPAMAPVPQHAKPGAGSTVMAAFLGLLLAACVVAIPVNLLLEINKIGAGIGDLKGPVLTANLLYLGAGLLVVFALLTSFVRSAAMSIFMLLGSLLSLVALFVEPALYEADYGEFIEDLFGLETVDAWFRLSVLVLAPLTLIFAVLPSTFRFLRRGKGNAHPAAQALPQGGYPGPGLPPGQPGPYGGPGQGGSRQGGPPRWG